MRLHALLFAAAVQLTVFARAAPPIRQQPSVPAQPFAAQAARVRTAMQMIGSPLPAKVAAALDAAASLPQDEAVSKGIQQALDPLCLVTVSINPESRVKVAPGAAKPVLIEHGWTASLVKVVNEAGVTSQLKVRSPNAGSLAGSPQAEIRGRWLDMMMFNGQPLKPALSGLAVEYRILLLYSRDSGPREAKLEFNVGQGTQDLGFRGEADILFQCRPANDVTLRVRDENGKPATAMFLIRDRQGRVYPSQAKRLAPDFAFHPQVYRADGEKVRLPAGEYTVEVARGPEYRTQTLPLSVARKPATLSVKLERWIDPAKLGWWSGDHHIHAAGCAHYEQPTQGVLAIDMMRHCLGEDLKVGCNLTWGPCFDYQKQFFTGSVDKVSQFPYLLRYDVEVSGFGSHQSGHLCLLRLKEQIYPGGASKDHWPSLCLNTLKWAKKQGAVCGPAHSGNGLQVNSNELPNYVIPPMDGIGAIEYIVDVTHRIPGPDGKLVPAVDFMSTVDTAYLSELNIWYHTLNCGYRTRISGETDFPCITGERVGKGRSYVKLDGKLDFDTWAEGIRSGRCYVSDGVSHLIDFAVNGQGVGEHASELALAQPGTVKVTLKAAALLSEKPNPQAAQGGYWHVERARIGETRTVPVEVVVNGQPVARKVITADGSMGDLTFDVPIERSCWVALRVLGSSHTNPIFVTVGDKPVRASRRSAEWCLKTVEQCWSQKQRFIKPEEMEDAKQAYEHARQEYRRILAECEVE